MPRKRKPLGRCAGAQRGSAQTKLLGLNSPKKFFAEEEKNRRILFEKQKAMFAPIAVTEGSKKRKIPGLNAYMRLLSQESTHGNPCATAELDHLQRQRFKTEQGRREQQVRAASPLAPRYERQKELARLGNVLGGAIYLFLLPGVWGAFEKVKGKLTFSESLIPPGLDPSIAAKQFETVQRRHARQQPSNGSEAGFCKPPKECQFAPGKSGNPRGRPPLGSVWDELQDDLLAVVWVTRSTKRERSTKAALSINQLLQKAMAGDRTARQALRKEIIELDDAGLLKPPTVQKRCKQTTDPRPPDLLRKVLPQAVQNMKRQMILLFSRRFNCTIPEFVTDFEQSLGETSKAVDSTVPLPEVRCRSTELSKKRVVKKPVASAARKPTSDDASELPTSPTRLTSRKCQDAPNTSSSAKRKPALKN